MEIFSLWDLSRLDLDKVVGSSSWLKRFVWYCWIFCMIRAQIRKEGSSFCTWHDIISYIFGSFLIPFYSLQNLCFILKIWIAFCLMFLNQYAWKVNSDFQLLLWFEIVLTPLFVFLFLFPLLHYLQSTFGSLLRSKQGKGTSTKAKGMSVSLKDLDPAFQGAGQKAYPLFLCLTN